ncbi:hypothetical protein AgCh_006306 [Apium graveolens]
MKEGRGWGASAMGWPRGRVEPRGRDEEKGEGEVVEWNGVIITLALEINSDVKNLNEVVPESPVASHTVVLSEYNESSSSSEESVSAETPVPILGKEELVKKFVEKEEPIPWEDTHRGVEWTKKWNDTNFIPSSNILTEHISKADELLTNADKAQLEEIQSSVELLLSLLLPDDAKKGEKVVKSKCSPTEILKKKDDKSDDQGNSDKSRGQGKVQGKSSTQNKSSSDAVNAKSLKSSFDKKRKELETLKEEEARFAAEKTNLKSKASDAEKPSRTKEKGIVIREKSNSETSKSKTRSKTEIDPKSKGKEKVGEPLKIEKKISSSIPVYQTTVNDDDLIEDETV